MTMMRIRHYIITIHTLINLPFIKINKIKLKLTIII